jgi:site-specific DNA-methyltransferase (adenine-specific)
MDKIIHADCMDVLSTFGDNQFDLLITDPPYGLNMAKRGRLGDKGRAREFTPMDWDITIPSRGCFDEMRRVSKNQIIWGGNYFTDHLPASRCWLVWHKRDGLPRNSFADCELAWTSFDRNAYVFNCRWFGFIKDSQEKRVAHPMQKALEVMKWCVREFSKEGDTILDPFSGSFTTAVAARQLNRRYVAIEREAEYVTIGRARLAFAA